MIYQNPEQIRCRINVIGRIINEARNYARRSLPAAYADFQHEYDELHAARADCTWFCKSKSIEIREATT